MTLADQAAIAGHDGQVTSGKPERPKSRTFTREFNAKIVAEFGALLANSPERGTLLRKNRLGIGPRSQRNVANRSLATLAL